MLIEINLLPKKQPKHYLFAILLGVVLVVLIGASVYLFGMFNRDKQHVAHLERQIQSAQQLAIIEQQKQDSNEKADSFVQLQKLVDWSEKYPIKTVPLLKVLVSLLPERGFFMEFSYVSEGDVQLTVQFDSASQSAQYLDDLVHSKWIHDAKLSSLSTKPAIKAETQTEDDVQQENEESKKDNGPVPGDPEQESEKKQSVHGTGTTDQLENGQYLPRYTAQYEVKLNKEFIQKQAQPSEQGSSPGESKGDGE